MAVFVNINFDTGLANRFKNIAGVSPAAVNFLNRVEIEPIEFFDGDSSGRFSGTQNVPSYLELATDTKFNFGDAGTAIKLYIRTRFMVLANGVYAFWSRRTDAANRWHVVIDTNTDDILFFANDGNTVAHNVAIDYFAEIGKLTLGKWHTLEMSSNGSIVRFFIDGVFVGSDDDAGDLIVDAGGAFVRIGQANISATATENMVYFNGYMDSIIFDDATVFGSVNHTGVGGLRTWTGNTEKIYDFATDLVPHPSIIDRSFPNNIPDFAVGNNQLYIVGIDEQRKIDNATAVAIGITKPTLPTLDGGVANNYDYVITFVDGRSNESPPSPRSSQRAATTQTITQTLSPVPANAVYWRVYRRNVTAGQAKHYLVKDNLPVATFTWADNIPAGSESLFKSAPPQSAFVIPQANYAAFRDTRMYYGYVKLASDQGGGTFPTRVYYTPPNNLDIIERETSWFYVGVDDSRPLTGLMTYRAATIAFKDNAMHGIIGDPESPDFNIVLISSSIGCVAHLTIKALGSKLIWMAADGVYTYDGGAEPVKVSEDIDRIFNSILDIDKPFATAAIDQEWGLYLLSVGGKIFCYHYQDSFRDNVQRWTEWLVGDTVLGAGRIDDTLKDIAFFASLDGRLGHFANGLDLNSGFSPVWQTPFLNSLNNVRLQRVSVSTFIVDSVGPNTKVFDCGFDIRSPEGEIYTRFIDPPRLNLKIHVGARCEYISYIFKGVDLRDPVKLLGINVDGQMIGHR